MKSDKMTKWEINRAMFAAQNETMIKSLELSIEVFKGNPEKVAKLNEQLKKRQILKARGL